MPAFSTKDQAATVFTQLFEILLEDEVFSAAVRTENLSALFTHSEPELTVFVDADGVSVDEVPHAPVMTIQMSCATADALWTGRLAMPVALATRKIKISGSVAKVIELVPMLHPAAHRYPQIAADAGVKAREPATT